MDDLALMGVLQGAGNVEDDVNRVADLQLAGALKQLMGAGAIHIFQHDVMETAGVILAGVVAVDDVGVGERGAVPAFEVKPL